MTKSGIIIIRVMVILLAVVIGSAIKLELRLDGNRPFAFQSLAMGLLSIFRPKSPPPSSAEEPSTQDRKPETAADAGLASRLQRTTWRRASFDCFPAGEDSHLISVRGRGPVALPSFAVDF